ncbi:MAG: helix-turn-helix transcriptional regulator [Oscillospiraceae bacterium]|jgi:transcriptional regulator with XRE-family HTH domain|nr:helix-turn-helix transcriptional regulator [Oscillospiraceae bacterium]
MLGNTIKRLRENSGFTQQQIADALSIDRSTYAYYELNKTSPSITTLRKLVKLFNVNYEVLIDGEDRSKLGDNRYNYQVTSVMSEHIYTLSKPEQELIIYYRLANEEERKTLIDSISSKIKERAKLEDEVRKNSKAAKAAK